MLEIDFKRLIIDKIMKEGSSFREYIKERVFFGWQINRDLTVNRRIHHPAVRKHPCITWTQARKIIMDSIVIDQEGWEPVDDRHYDD